MRKAAWILWIITTVYLGLFIIPLIWTIPMLKAYKRAIYDNKSHVKLAVWSLFVGNFISGILMLISGNKGDSK
ncbi:MAG: hypothetical protein LBV22_00375 [Mycoplasmataceae bacterium]|jgi:RsiW-degrading membrane proteinase PrsW (M82 family)|nr:hypothetical protein [Mycoplasmataceae bacterium]